MQHICEDIIQEERRVKNEIRENLCNPKKIVASQADRRYLKSSTSTSKMMHCLGISNAYRQK